MWQVYDCLGEEQIAIKPTKKEAEDVQEVDGREGICVFEVEN